MNGALDLGITSFYLRRIAREPLGLLIFTVLPAAVAWVMSAVYTANTPGGGYLEGYNMVATHLSIFMLLLFQLNSGIYLLEYLNRDLFGPMMWRLGVSPRSRHVFVFSAVAACTVFTMLQGLLIIGFTGIVLDAYWGNLAVAALVVLMVSLVSQLLNMLLFLVTKTVSATEMISWIFAIATAALGGLMFRLPDTPVFRFMSTYGTPFTLGQSAIRFSGSLGSSAPGIWPGVTPGSEPSVLIGLAGLAAWSLALAGGVVAVGRRKLS